MLEEIIERSRNWRNRMAFELNLPSSSYEQTFSDIVLATKLSNSHFMELCKEISLEIGSFNYRELNSLHNCKAYCAIIEIILDEELHLAGEIFWLEHPDYPEIVFEHFSEEMEVFKVYVIDAEEAAQFDKPGDSILLWTNDLERVASIIFVATLPESVENKRQMFLQQKKQSK